jgi:hypothetical protein
MDGWCAQRSFESHETRGGSLLAGSILCRGTVLQCSCNAVHCLSGAVEGVAPSGVQCRLVTLLSGLKMLLCNVWSAVSSAGDTHTEGFALVVWLFFLLARFYHELGLICDVNIT